MNHSQRRIPELDGFRGIAVLMVLLYHLFAYSMFGGRWSGLASLTFEATKDGWRGVDLFFVLSGFLITGILLDSRADSYYFRNFYARRALRILPLYYAVLAVILLAYHNSASYFWLSFFFLSNLAPMLDIPMLNGAMWSLSVEEHYYLVWPFVVHRLRMRSVAIVAVLICALEPAIRALSLPYVGSANIYILSPFRLDGLASGALIACFVRSAWYSPRNVTICAATAVLLGIALRIAGAPYGILSHNTPFGAGLEFVPLNFIFAAAMLYSVANSGSAATAILRNGFLRLAADLSYCLYLIHFLVMGAYDVVAARMGWPSFAGNFGATVQRAGIVLVLCFVLAALSRRFLESPALRFKKRFSVGREVPSR